MARVRDLDGNSIDVVIQSELDAVANPGGATPNLAAVLAEGNDAGGLPITSVQDPANDQDAATKKYVDDQSLAPTQGQYVGSPLSVPNNSGETLTLATLASGDELLDISTADSPTFLEDGVYALTAVIVTTAPLTAGGYARAHIGYEDAQAIVTSEHPADGCTVSLTIKAVAGGVFAIGVTNRDGASTRSFQVSNLTVVKIR